MACSLRVTASGFLLWVLAVGTHFGCSSTATSQGGTDAGSTDDTGTSDAALNSEGDTAPPTCDPDESPSDGVFVSAASGDDAGGDGSPGQPLQTIAAAIAATNAAGKSVIYLDQGTYDESVSIPDLPSGLFIEGGWRAIGAVWERDCSADAHSKTLISAPGDSPIAVHVTGVTKTSGLRTLTVRSPQLGPAQANASGSSSIGIWVDGSVFSLADVDVLSGRGADGGRADAGTSGNVLACDGVSDCQAGADATAPGAPGVAANTGAFAASGFIPGDGSPGEPGPDGENGTPSPVGPQSATCPQGCRFPGSCGCDPDPAVFVSAGAGRCGCAGGAGGGGLAGRGGGASIALLATGATTVNVTRGTLRSADGGAGSEGGAGGSPVAGSSGAAGADATCVTGCGNGGVCGNCGTVSQSTLSGGAAGGPGGRGGAGGAGGPGAGGPSFSIVRAAGARVLLDAATVLAFGNPGPGAASGGVTAPSGQAAEVHEF